VRPRHQGGGSDVDNERERGLGHHVDWHAHHEAEGLARQDRSTGTTTVPHTAQPNQGYFCSKPTRATGTRGADIGIDDPSLASNLHHYSPRRLARRAAVAAIGF
jgi:hypothetical protein